MDDSTPILENFLNKPTLNNFINVQSPKAAKEIISPKWQASPPKVGKFYSQEVEELRQELLDQIRIEVGSLSSQFEQNRRENHQFKMQVLEMRNDLDVLGSKVLEYQSINQADINELRNERYKREMIKSDGFDKIQLSNRLNQFEAELGAVNEKISEINRQIFNINHELEKVQGMFVAKDIFKKNLGDIIDEIERKLNILNENTKEQMKIMNSNFVEIMKQKDEEFYKVGLAVKSLHANVSALSSPKNTQNSRLDTDEEIKQNISTHFNRIKNISMGGGSPESRFKFPVRNEQSILTTTTAVTNKEIDMKLKELDTIYQSVILLEKEMRSKSEMVDLNINSIKRNLELELTLELKRMIVPIQKNIDEYLKNTDHRIAVLEDAVMNDLKKESNIMYNESGKLRDSNLFTDQTHPGKSSIHNVLGSGLRDSDQWHTSSHEPVVYHERTRSKDKTNLKRSFINTDSAISITPDEREEASRESVEYEEKTLTNTAIVVKPDHDRQRVVHNPSNLFRNITGTEAPEPEYTDFPGIPAMKNQIEFDDYSRRSLQKSKGSSDFRSSATKDTSRLSGKKEEQSHSIRSPTQSQSEKKMRYNESNEEDDSAPSYDHPLSRSDLKSESKKLEIEYQEEYSGSVKGLLNKARSKKASSLDLDFESRKANLLEKKQGYQEDIPGHSRKNPLLENPLEKSRHGPDVLARRTGTKSLPPVDIKGANKLLNQQAANKNKQKNDNMRQTFPTGDKKGFSGFSGRKDLSYGRIEEEPEEDIEEIVYHVNEEGFLVDENGNLLTDEQGNFLKLSDDQLKELQENDIVYEGHY